jgi:hypothetical protein
MPRSLKNAASAAFCLAAILAASLPALASVDDAQSFALQAAEPYVKEGFQVREDYWGGDLGAPEQKAVKQQLFKGNEYWFWLGTEVEKAKISVHIYDSEGKLVEKDSWQKSHFAAAHVVPQATGSYFIIVSVEESPEERTHWALVYGFR